MRIKNIDSQIGSVFKKIGLVLGAFTIVFSVGNAIENAGGTYAVKYGCPSGYTQAANTSNYCCPDNGETYSGYNLYSEIPNVCSRILQVNDDCNYSLGEKHTLINAENVDTSFDVCYIDGKSVEAVKYTFTINPNSGTVTYNGQNVTSVKNFEIVSDSVITLPTPKRSGYKFKHWINGAGTKTYNGGESITLTGNLTITAVWEQNSCYYCASSGTAEWGSSIPSASCPSTWSKQPAITAESNCTTRTLTYVLVGGTMSGSTTYKNIHGASVTLPKPNKDGYRFKHWINGAGTKTYNDGESITLTGDLTLTAVWEEETAQTYSVVFNVGTGGTFYENKVASSRYDRTLSVVNYSNYTAEKTGYTFTGWGMASGCTSGAKTGTLNITKTTTLYACYTSNNSGGTINPPVGTGTTLEATFNSNGGSWTDGSLALIKRSTCTTLVGETSCTISSLPSITKDGYTFNGWGSNKSCTLGSTSSLTLNSDESNYYYACFTKNGDDNTSPPSEEPETNKPSTSNPDTGTTDTEIEENPNTGSFLLYVVYLVGILSLGYTGYYIYKVVKLKK